MITAAIINPGSGPIDDASEDLATKAIEQFVKDTGSEIFTREKKDDLGDGRYAFDVYRRNEKGKLRKFEVDMPGVPIDQVRYLGPPQNIWNFPRLLVDGSSWVWKYAVNRLTDTEDEDDDE